MGNSGFVGFPQGIPMHIPMTTLQQNSPYHQNGYLPQTVPYHQNVPLFSGYFGYNTSRPVAAGPSVSTNIVSSAPQAHFTGTFGVSDQNYCQDSQGVTTTSFSSNHTQPTQQYTPSSARSAHQISNTNPSNAPQWYFDSGATHHITNNLQNLNLTQPVSHDDGTTILLKSSCAKEVNSGSKASLRPFAGFSLAFRTALTYISRNVGCGTQSSESKYYQMEVV
ncbi:hypothetical protein Vadar_002223 [Vaccinium darrowii]|uniref:Uncharacterized protein n=1 Tax=Vaccinium darrowii TaxID=229202 RepID=A0ACB7ZGY4_9ERIC|nr:hypothetical protein Vadar_002223 [Vaccinium darrowii]